MLTSRRSHYTTTKGGLSEQPAALRLEVLHLRKKLLDCDVELFRKAGEAEEPGDVLAEELHVQRDRIALRLAAAAKAALSPH